MVCVLHFEVASNASCFSFQFAFAVVDTNFGEFVRVGDASTPMLIRLHERGWGALAALPASKISEAGYKDEKLPECIAVVRDAFAAHDESPRLLADAIQPLGAGVAAVASDISEPHERLVVDQYEYRSADDHYHLLSIGTDFFRFLRGHGLTLRQVPDVRAAAASVQAAAVDESSTYQVKQSTNEVLMVAPTAFVFNHEAAQDNTFMNATNTNTGENISASVTRKVLREFSELYECLTERAGLKVNLFQHSLDHGTPDAVFPNNWFSTHPAGECPNGSTLVYYPMKCPNRQAERRDDIMGVLSHMGYDRLVDMSSEEKNDKYFEGTGVLVLDRVRRIAYVALSERAHVKLAEQWVEKLGYNDLVTFHSTDAAGKPVYHTNVMMAIGTGVAVVCLESIADVKERQRLVSVLSRSHEIVDISRQQMAALCGNVLEVEDGRGLPGMAMSTQAFNAFTEEQKKAMRRHVADLYHASIDTLEHIGGGGVRCTLAEIFR